jgi:hypothetical protein
MPTTQLIDSASATFFFATFSGTDQTECTSMCTAKTGNLSAPRVKFRYVGGKTKK